MDSSWTLVCVTALLLVSLSSAAQDEPFPEQREISEADEMMMQREVDLTDLLFPFDLPINQEIVVPPRPAKQADTLSPRGFNPRSYDHPTIRYPVQFPLGRPTSENIQSICLHSDRRPRYPDSYFPASGYTSSRIRASAVNRLESWLGWCCQENQTWAADVMLCCATQAWELFVKSFCEENSSIKISQYKCCKLRGSDRHNCFNQDTKNPNYEPTEEIPLPPLDADTTFNFDSNTCQRSVISGYRSKGIKPKKEKKVPVTNKVDINFPPGRPTADNVESLCQTQGLRPRYSVKCLPGTGYEWLAHQAKTINRMEKGFKQCCKKNKNRLDCTERKWSEELDRFCSNKKQEDFTCCSVETPSDRYSCFQNDAPNPQYNVTTEEPTLGKICDTHKIIKKKFSVGFPLKRFVDQCCPLSEEERDVCSEQQVVQMSSLLCSSAKASPPAVRRCCHLPSQETSLCVSKILTDAVTKASSLLRQKKKKRCPIS